MSKMDAKSWRYHIMDLPENTMMSRHVEKKSQSGREEGAELLHASTSTTLF